MATLGELKTRIQLETNRDDIASGGEAEQALTDAIGSAIGYHANELFWFNRASGSVDTSAGVETVALPSGVLYATLVAYNGCQLINAEYAEMAALTGSGQPTHWAENGGGLQLYPIPDAAYTLTVSGLADIGVPASDSESNAWTTQGYDLIDARARIYLYRDYWRDPEGAQIAAIAELDALNRLRRESRKRSALERINMPDAPYTRSSFNIFTG